MGYEEWGAGAAVRPTAVTVAAVAAAHAAAGPAALASRDFDAQLRARAADRIEAVARRVRTGELRPLGLTPAMTEAGALAATLAALLTPSP